MSFTFYGTIIVWSPSSSIGKLCPAESGPVFDSH